MYPFVIQKEKKTQTIRSLKLHLYSNEGFENIFQLLPIFISNSYSSLIIKKSLPYSFIKINLLNPLLKS